mgnify:CR=1 FL=1
MYVEPGTAGGQESPVEDGEELNFTQLKCIIVDLRRRTALRAWRGATGDACRAARTRDKIKERFLLPSRSYGAGTLAT